MKKGFLIVLGSALITAGAIKAAPAFAEPLPPANTAIVKTADLDLRTSAGQRKLDYRLASAAREVCGQASDTDLKGKNAVRACRVETLAEARKRGNFVLAGGSSDRTIAVVAAH